MESMCETTISLEAPCLADSTVARADEATLVIEPGPASPYGTTVAVARASGARRHEGSGMAPGAVCGKYEIIRELGKGGQGRVLLAIDHTLRRYVALKTLTAVLAGSEEAIRRLQNEALAVARLKHASIVEPYEVFQERGIPFLAMEYVDGEPLLEAVRRGVLTRCQAVETLARCCEAMHHAHEHGVVHRDLKPQNILVANDGTPKVMDFGLAKCLLEDGGISMATVAGRVLGSPAYMAPEQAQGRRDQIGPATDVYALGITLYQCLTGELPHLAETPMETMMQVIHEAPPPLASVDATISPDLSAICMKAIEKDPEDRYGSAGDMAADLRRYLNNEPVKARPATAADRLKKALQRNRDIALVSGLALTFMALTVFIALGLFLRQSAANAGEGLKAELRSVATTAALMFSAEEIASVQSDVHEDEPGFRELARRLNEVRRSNPQIRSAAILGRRGNRPGYVFVVDADSLLPAPQRNGAPRAGEAYASGGRIPAWESLDATAVDDEPVRGQWGDTLSGYAPITQEGGGVTALLKLGIGAERMTAHSRPVPRTCWQVSGVATLLFMGLTGAAGFRVARKKRQRR